MPPYRNRDGAFKGAQFRYRARKSDNEIEPSGVLFKGSGMLMNQQQISIPDKLYFKIGEVSELLGLPTYVLRFWETEFKRIKPKRSPTGQRLYRKKDVEFILKIRYLLHEQGFTISGARQYLRSKQDFLEELPNTLSVNELRRELQQIRELLKPTP
jgi:DNA-binding transcriptional MerR regulator